MKLRTEMSHSNSWHAPRAVGFAIEEDDERDQFRHDAAAAHALMQAIDALGAKFAAIGVDGMVIVATLGEALRNADELMREWGFDQDKVAP
jgi:hypothetical protein